MKKKRKKLASLLVFSCDIYICDCLLEEYSYAPGDLWENGHLVIVNSFYSLEADL